MGGLVNQEFAAQHRELWRSHTGKSRPRPQRRQTRKRTEHEGEYILHERIEDLVTAHPATLLRPTKHPSIEIVFEGILDGSEPSDGGDVWELSYNSVDVEYNDPVNGLDKLLPVSIDAATLHTAISNASGVAANQFVTTAFPGRYFIEALPVSVNPVTYNLDVDLFAETADFDIYRRRIEWARYSTQWVKAAHLGLDETFSAGNFCHGKRRLNAMRVVSICREFRLTTGTAPDPDGGNPPPDPESGGGPVV